MAVVKIVEVPAESLREKSKAVRKVDKKIKNVIKDLWDTIKVQDDPEGVGLAAPQIGKNVQIFIMDYEGVKRTVINPKVIKKVKVSGNKKGKDNNNPFEGCLSLPHYYGPIERADRITISYINEKEESVEEEFKGFLANIVQHEIDHLNGVLFVDHILKQEAPLYRVSGEEWQQVELQ